MSAKGFLFEHRGRIAIACLALALALGIAIYDFSFASVQVALELAERLIRNHPVWGVLAFVAGSALSAMLAFVSTAVLVPFGIYAWGEFVTFVLLWVGWLLGGLFAYCIGRFLGRRIVIRLVSRDHLDRYEDSVNENVSWTVVFLFQLALPSEVPGYLLGIVRYRFAHYLLALALAELPFAIGAVYLGKSFLDRNYPMLIAIGSAGILFTMLAIGLWHRHGHRA